MIQIGNINVFGFEAAIRGMRNPMNSWEKSDSVFNGEFIIEDNHLAYKPGHLGGNDVELMRKLFNGGTEHRKYLRMIHVSMDVVAPLYWWKEFDTYKVGTVANSCSTMHKIADKEFVRDDFSIEHLDKDSITMFTNIIDWLNIYRERYLIHHSKNDWWQMIQMLPTSYNQRRTVDFNYETMFKIIEQRSDHKLDEWVEFVNELKDLPYVRVIGQLS